MLKSTLVALILCVAMVTAEEPEELSTLGNTHTHTHTHTQTHTHTRTDARTHARTHTHTESSTFVQSTCLARIS